MRWVFPINSQGGPKMGKNGSLIGSLLARRGIVEDAAVQSFLRPRLQNLADPFLLPGMQQAVDRLLHAVSSGEKVVLYGDYDVDGVTSLALLYRVLLAMGLKTECFLPLRAEEGYGLSEAGLERCFETHCPQLLIALDCGTNSTAEIAHAARQGADVIVVDHHEPQPARPNCVAVINPKLGSDFHELCTAGIVFKLCHALLKADRHPEIDLRQYLDLVALATVADLVPLAGENRILVHRGLVQMRDTRWPGLSELMRVSAVRGGVRSSDVGFRLGPRINASGRLANAQESLRLLLTDDPGEARGIAASLDLQNRERQSVERGVADEAEAMVSENVEVARCASIVVGRRGWHHGVVGIVASRLSRRWHRPTIVVGFDESGEGKGSCRSIAGVCIVTALSKCSELLERFGGHEMAAGITVRETSFSRLQMAFEAAARALSTEEILTPRLCLDAEISAAEIGEPLLEELELMEPFGVANPRPVFALRGVAPAAPPRTLKEKHLLLSFAGAGRRMEAIYFNGADSELPKPPWDLAVHVTRNDFNGQIQLQVAALRPCQ